jgi:hypothetical protein
MLKLRSIKTREFACFVDAHLAVNIPNEEAIRQQQMKRAITLIEQRPPIEPNSQRAWSKVFRGNHQTVAWCGGTPGQAPGPAGTNQMPAELLHATQLPEVVALRLAGLSQEVPVWDLSVLTLLLPDRLLTVTCQVYTASKGLKSPNGLARGCRCVNGCGPRSSYCSAR